MVWLRGARVHSLNARWGWIVKLLLDTNIISYWHSGQPKFRVPLGNYFRKVIRANKDVKLYVSVITIQELSCWAKPNGKWESIKQFLNVKFATPLSFCELCTHQAANMQVRAGPNEKTSETAKAEWHHDAAIIGTAAQHELDIIVTADKQMHTRYSSLFDQIVHIPEAGS